MEKYRALFQLWHGLDPQPGTSICHGCSPKKKKKKKGLDDLGFDDDFSDITQKAQLMK